MVNGMTCWEMLGAIGAWEYHDPGSGPNTS